nr:uncharacterized protein LOC110365784 isoform X2 [Columba livia]
MFHLDEPVWVWNKLRYGTSSWPEELKVSELIYAEAALRLHMPKKKVLKCLEATMIVIAWALTEGKDFDVVFKNLGILVCRGKTVIMRFFEDLLRDVDKTGVLVNNFLQNSKLRPLIIASTETSVFHMPPEGIFVFPQFVYKDETSEKELAAKTAQRACPGEHLIPRGHLSPGRTSGLGVPGEKRRKAGRAAGATSNQGSRAAKCKGVTATECHEVRLPPLDPQMGASVARRPSEIPPVRWPDLSLRFPCPKGTGQDRAKAQPGWQRGKRNGEEMSRYHPWAEQRRTPAPWLRTPWPDPQPPRARQVLPYLDLSRSRQEWRMTLELNKLWTPLPKQLLCEAKNMELHDPRGKHAARPAARGLCVQHGRVTPRRPAPQH